MVLGGVGGSKYMLSPWTCFSHCGVSVFLRGKTVPLFQFSPNHLAMEAAGRSGGVCEFQRVGGWSLGFKMRLKAYSVHYGDRGR